MAVAIREIDLSSPLTTLNDLGSYERCMLVFRWRRRVVGRTFVAVDDSRIDAGVVAEAAARLGFIPGLAWVAETLDYDERAAVGAPALTATIAICTRERPDDLVRVLHGVREQTHTGHDVLVVDNAPLTDRTRQVVEQFPGVRYLCEPAPGLNRARNCAVRNAGGEVVAFTDDDATPE